MSDNNRVFASRYEHPPCLTMLASSRPQASGSPGLEKALGSAPTAAYQGGCRDTPARACVGGGAELPSLSREGQNWASIPPNRGA